MDDAEFKKVYESFSDSLEMVEDAIVAARQALLENPTKEERRELNEQILELEAKRAKITNKLIALGRPGAAVSPPTDAQIAEIKGLAEEVDKLTRASEGAARAISVAPRGLDMVAKAGMA